MNSSELASNDDVSVAEKAATASGSAFSSIDERQQPPTNRNKTVADHLDWKREKLETKMEKIRDKLTRNSIGHEHDVEEFLKLTSHQTDNPQIARIKQHFEKKNKKHAQEAVKLQKKLEDYERQLNDLDSADAPKSSAEFSHAFNRCDSGRFVHSFGNEIRSIGRRTGANLMHGPLEIAEKMRRNVFGSAEELRRRRSTSPAVPCQNVGGLYFGNSTFYDAETKSAAPAGESYKNERTAPARAFSPQSNAVESGIVVPMPTTDGAAEGTSAAIYSDDLSSPKEEGGGAGDSGGELSRTFHTLRQRHAHIQRQFDTFSKETKAELRSQENEIVNSRFRIQHLEQAINEALELHQNELKQLKNDLNMIGIRMDYQYNDRFKKIEESIESTENNMVRIETSWRESASALERYRSPWNSLVFSGANIVVELLKITLYLIAVTLDSVRVCLDSLGFSGTRKRAGIVLITCITLFLFWNHLHAFALSIFSIF
uniref:Uncharacterized protein n=1 Tax=Globodera pallida TaxID=36090 RepID=A0A183C3A2_GLOPA